MWKAHIMSAFFKTSNSYMQDCTTKIESVLIQRLGFNMAIPLGSNSQILDMMVDVEYLT